MALLMLGSEEYSQQVVKHQNGSQNSANLIMHFQKKTIISPNPHRRDWQFLGGTPKTLNKCLKIKWDSQMGGGRKNAFFGRGMDIFWSYIM